MPEEEKPLSAGVREEDRDLGGGDEPRGLEVV